MEVIGKLRDLVTPCASWTRGVNNAEGFSGRFMEGRGKGGGWRKGKRIASS